MDKPAQPLQDNPTKLALTAGLGMFLSTLDSGVINVAIPQFTHVFHAPISTIIWTITLYILALSATILLFGKLADRFGRLRIYQWGLWLFAISSLLCGLSHHINILILFRGLQGISAAMLQATAIALITTRTQKADLAKAMGIMGMLLGLGPTMGPVVGGLILSSLGWRWIFWINIPICLIGLYGCRTLTRVSETLHVEPIHYRNLSLIALASLILLTAMDFISKQHPYMWTMLIAAMILWVAYIISELTATHPAINLRLFKRLSFTAPILVVIAFGGATAVTFVLPPLYLAKLRGFEPWQIGLVSLSAPINLAIMAKFAARISQRFGSLPTIMLGNSCMLVSLFSLANIQPTWPIAQLVCLLWLYGLGAGLLQIPCYLYITNQFPMAQHAFISALIRMVQNLAIAFESAGAALLISLQANNKAGLLIGLHHGWYLAATIASIALISLGIHAIKATL